MSDNKPLHVRVAEALGWVGVIHPDPEIAKSLGGYPFGGTEADWFGFEPSGPEDPPRAGKVPRYDTDWSATGPLIEQLKQDGWTCGIQSENGGAWLAWLDDIGQNSPHEAYRGHGSTPLIAICNLILALSEAGKLPK